MRETAIDSKRGQIATEARTRTREQHEWRCLSESASLRKNHNDSRFAKEARLPSFEREWIRLETERCQNILPDVPFHRCQQIFRFFRKGASPYVPVQSALAVVFL